MLALTRTITDGGGPIRTETYGYDELSRLTSVDYGDGATQGYAFDPMGNRTSKTEGQTTEGYTYNNANMLLTRGAGSYTNDNNGNTLTGGGRTNTWDSQNRLSSCTFQGATSTFVYGADGLRRQSTVNGTTTDYLLDGQSVVRTLLSGAVDRTYLTGPRGPEYERVGAGAAKWNLYDGLGSVVGTVDASGNILSKRKYDLYGSVRGLIGESGTKHKFVGNLGHPSEDETGLIYMRARYYDSLIGRFSSEDRAKRDVNWFAYALCRPNSVVDPSGNFSWPDWLAAQPGWNLGINNSQAFRKVAESWLFGFLVYLVPFGSLGGLKAGTASPEAWAYNVLGASLAAAEAKGPVVGVSSAKETVAFYSGYSAIILITLAFLDEDPLQHPN